MPQVPIYQQQVGGTNAGFQQTQFADPYGMRVPLNNDIGTGLVRLSGYAKKYQDDLDETLVADRLSDLKRYAQEQRTGDNGYLKLHGSDAMAKDNDGFGLADRVDRQIKDYGTQLGLDLTPRQRLAFQKGATNVYTQQYAFSTQHVITESDNFMKGQAKGRIDASQQMLLANVGNPDVEQTCLADIESAQSIIDRRNGVSEEEHVLNVRKAKGDAIYAAITSVMQSSGDPITANTQAATLFGAYKQFLAPEQLAGVSLMRNKNQDAIITKTSGETAFSALKKERGQIQNLFALGIGMKTHLSADEIMGNSAGLHTAVIMPIESGGRQFEERADGHIGALTGRRKDGSLPAEHERAYGVSQMQIGVAKNVAKAHGIEWSLESFEQDRFYNKQLGELFLGDLMKKYDGDIYKAFAAYHNGEPQVNDAVAAAKKAGDESKWLDYLGPNGRDYVAKCKKQIELLQNPKVLNSRGEEANFFDGDYAESSYQSVTRAGYKKWLQQSNPLLAGKANAWRLEQAVDEAEKLQTQDKTDYLREQENVKGQIIDAIYSGATADDLQKSGLWGKLNVREQRDVSTVLRKLRVGDATGNEKLATLYINDPDLWAKQPEGKMRSLLLIMPKDKAQILYDRWYKANVGAAVTDNSLMTARLRAEKGVYQSEFDSPYSAIDDAFQYADPTWWNGLKKDVRDRLVSDATRVANSLGVGAGKKLKTGEELRQHGFNSYVRYLYKVSGMFFDSHKNVFNLEVSDLPNSGISSPRAIIEDITKQRVGRQDVSTEELTSTLRDVLLNPYSKVRWEETTLDKDTLAALRKRYPGVGNGLELLRYYIRDSMAGEIRTPLRATNRPDLDRFYQPGGDSASLFSYGDYRTEDYSK